MAVRHERIGSTREVVKLGDYRHRLAEWELKRILPPGLVVFAADSTHHHWQRTLPKQRLSHVCAQQCGRRSTAQSSHVRGRG